MSRRTASASLTTSCPRIVAVPASGSGWSTGCARRSSCRSRSVRAARGPGRLGTSSRTPSSARTWPLGKIFDEVAWPRRRGSMDISGDLADGVRAETERVDGLWPVRLVVASAGCSPRHQASWSRSTAPRHRRDPRMPYVFDFDHSTARPPMELKDLLGGKGANLAEMTSVLELPVPPGFTISTDACRAYMKAGWPTALDREVARPAAPRARHGQAARRRRRTRCSSRCAPGRSSRCPA